MNRPANNPMNTLKSKLCNIALFLAVIYAAASLAVSVALANYPEDAEHIAAHRNGLLLAGVDQSGAWVLSPFCNWVDVYLLGIGRDDSGALRIYSDGLTAFGEWDIAAAVEARASR